MTLRMIPFVIIYQLGKDEYLLNFEINSVEGPFGHTEGKSPPR
jgi:hypothetical protein